MNLPLTVVVLDRSGNLVVLCGGGVMVVVVVVVVVVDVVDVVVVAFLLSFPCPFLSFLSPTPSPPKPLPLPLPLPPPLLPSLSFLKDGATMFRLDVATGKAWGAIGFSCSSRYKNNFFFLLFFFYFIVFFCFVFFLFLFFVQLLAFFHKIPHLFSSPFSLPPFLSPLFSPPFSPPSHHPSPFSSPSRTLAKRAKGNPNFFLTLSATGKGKFLPQPGAVIIRFV